jgi:hypothetical protein
MSLTHPQFYSGDIAETNKACRRPEKINETLSLTQLSFGKPVLGAVDFHVFLLKFAKAPTRDGTKCARSDSDCSL